MRIFITGAAGFIGFHLSKRLLALGHDVIGYDGLTDYYDVRLKQQRLAELAHERFQLATGMLEDADRLTAALAAAKADIVVHLAAQAGVRYSIEAPQSYISSNVVGTANLLEALRVHKPAHFLFASTSSVYGGNDKMPFAETDRADQPISLYAATKKSGEAMTHSYAHLFGIPTTCFRFFTVYGPWGRPDMALFKFVSAIEEGRPIELFNNGEMYRDFTYVDDLISAVVSLAGVIPQVGEAVSELDTLSPVAPWRVVNIAGGNLIALGEFVDAIEEALGQKAIRRNLPAQPGDMLQTMANPKLLQQLIGMMPETDLDTGVAAFVDWYRAVYAPRQG